MYLNEMMKAVHEHLTKSEKEIACYIDKNIENVMYFSISDLSDEIGVGESTIVRFCRKLGYRGFYEFKIELAKQFASETNNHSENYIDLIESNMINILKSTKLIVNKDSLQQAIDMVLNGKYIYLYGIGSSGLAALEGEGKFMRGGLKCKAVVDSHFQTILSGTLTDEDVIIAISLSGNTKDLLDAIDIAYKNGTKIIAMTNYLKSKLAKFAHVTLQTAGYEKPLDGGSFCAKVSQLYMLDLLYTGVMLKDQKNIVDKERKAAEAISRKID